MKYCDGSKKSDSLTAVDMWDQDEISDVMEGFSGQPTQGVLDAEAANQGSIEDVWTLPAFEGEICKVTENSTATVSGVPSLEPFNDLAESFGGDTDPNAITVGENVIYAFNATQIGQSFTNGLSGLGEQTPQYSYGAKYVYTRDCDTGEENENFEVLPSAALINWNP